uniref:RIPOR family member 3 n=1 Tax=Myripristis murdjan TaxID=586833 RepID=A0A667Y3L9_9TELE
MSVKLQFDSPSDGGLVHRSRSFTGFSSLTGRRRPSSLHNSLRSKAMAAGKSPRVHLSPSRAAGAIWTQQPEQVDRIFQALRRGLKEYLECHQVEMDFLSSQQRETKRNSRLVRRQRRVCEIRALERYIRRLEFQISKVEELYETYCIQWRLCQGAVNMKRAFSLSPSTRASRDSLLELNRNHRHSLQDMSVLEGELEILLGELHIKMKGLIGFARLCPGDQYEVMVRLGRQRWRIKGRIQSDDRQSWDEEEMVFLPHIHHNFEIKVTEAKGLGWLLVGMVTCASADFFVARPQLMLVDITELGTLKLQLEVSWNPFDSSERMRAVSPSRQSVSSRKGSVYSWTAPSTPSFTEKYFIVSTHTYTCHDSAYRLIHSYTPTNTQAQTYTYTQNLSENTESPLLPDASPRNNVSIIAHFTEVFSQSPSATCVHVCIWMRGHICACIDICFSNQNDLSLLKSSSSEETLAVEEVLGSFDFLSHDFNCVLLEITHIYLFISNRISSFQQSTLRSLGLLSQDSQSASEDELAISPLTSGNWSLDQALETHLDICSILLQAINTVDCSLSKRDLLEEMALQAEVLDRVSCLLLEKNDTISASDILPKTQRTRDVLLFWEECVDNSSSSFCCHADSFSRTLRKRYTHKVKAKQPGQSEKVFSQLLQQVQAGCRMVPSPRPVCSPERVTLFQLSVYLKRWGIHDLGEHISRLSKEVYILSALRSPKRRQALKKLRGRGVVELLPLSSTLQTLAALQIDPNHKVCKAAASCLCRAAGCKAFRTKAVVYYTESLKQTDVQTQQAACLALKCLRATESVDQIAELWRSADEDLRSAARETVLSFGKKGHLAFQRMDQLYTEMQEEAYQNQDTEITIL